jgi:hypothetical protein
MAIASKAPADAPQIEKAPVNLLHGAFSEIW